MRYKTYVIPYLALAIVFFVIIPENSFAQCCGCSGGFCSNGKHKLVGETSPDFTLSTADDSSVSLSDFDDNVVLIAFISSWSDNAKAVLPFLSTINNTFASEGLTVLGITPESDKETIKLFCDENSLPFPVLMNGGEQFESYLVGGMPEMVLVDRRGRVYDRLVGYAPDSMGVFEVTVSVLVSRKNLLFQ